MLECGVDAIRLLPALRSPPARHPRRSRETSILDEGDDGHSLLPFRHGSRSAKWRDGLFYEFDFRAALDPSLERRFGIEMDDCCLAVYQTERWRGAHLAALPPLVFDLENGPGAFGDLARDPAFDSEPLPRATE